MAMLEYCSGATVLVDYKKVNEAKRTTDPGLHQGREFRCCAKLNLVRKNQLELSKGVGFVSIPCLIPNSVMDLYAGFVLNYID
ncbi:uncharacterized protein LOC127128095 isoform X2 [Lathyrus oleraceus]|uniref:uncharacterized protein LOC127128095 isoform X2 n=1 Tax=Pisum sativum TaxID=3888 RepID=UPI0021CFCBA5|nr:uncharacterized protein LOC127128095 isoform X2 [Pisum sativum]